MSAGSKAGDASGWSVKYGDFITMYISALALRVRRGRISTAITCLIATSPDRPRRARRISGACSARTSTRRSSAPARSLRRDTILMIAGPSVKTGPVGTMLSGSRPRFEAEWSPVYIDDGGFAPSSGDTGSMGAPASRRCAASASASPWRPRSLAVPMGRGGSARA